MAGGEPRLKFTWGGLVVVLLLAALWWWSESNTGNDADPPGAGEPTSASTPSVTDPPSAAPSATRTPSAAGSPTASATPTFTAKPSPPPRPSATASPTPTAPTPSSSDEVPDRDPLSGLDVVTVEELPVEAEETIELIDDGGPFPYDRDGITFSNYEGILPDSSRGYYREYTVETPGLSHRGARRIVVGGGRYFYWTEDHYESFERIWR